MTLEIFKTKSGDITSDVIVHRGTMYTTKIIVDNPYNLLGFRNGFNHSFTDGVQILEVAHFMNMLYEGIPEAFDLLNVDDQYVETRTFEFDIIKRREQDLLSYSLLTNVVSQAKQSYESLEGEDLKSRGDVSKFSVERLGYNRYNAYICIKNLFTALSILQDGVYKVQDVNPAVLQAVLDGRFSKAALGNAYEEKMAEIERLMELTELPSHPDPEVLNEILLDVRNVEIIDKNVEKI